MPPRNFSWLIPDRLAGMGLPRSVDELAALRAQGVRALVSLHEQPLPIAALERCGLTATHIPIADFTAPTMEQAADAVAAIDRALANGEPVAVHCHGGMGRTGTILACYLVAHGMGAADAIARLRALRPGSIETPEQEAAVVAFTAMRAADTAS